MAKCTRTQERTSQRTKGAAAGPLAEIGSLNFYHLGIQSLGKGSQPRPIEQLRTIRAHGGLCMKPLGACYGLLGCPGSFRYIPPERWSFRLCMHVRGKVCWKHEKRGLEEQLLRTLCNASAQKIQVHTKRSFCRGSEQSRLIWLPEPKVL